MSQTPILSLKRPRGITVLIIIGLFGGTIGLIFNVPLAIQMMTEPGRLTFLLRFLPSSYYNFTGSARNVLDLLTAYGFIRRSGWSWKLAVILTIISVIDVAFYTILNLSIAHFIVTTPFAIITARYIISYLRKPHVKLYFGMGKATPNLQSLSE